VFIDPDPQNPDSLSGPPPRVGRHVNGQLCFFPSGFGHDGQFVVSDDTYRESCLDRNPPEARCSVTDRGSRFYIGKDPDGWCVFGANGNMFGTDVGTGDPTDPDPSHHGSLLAFFPGPLGRYDTYCFLDKDISQAGMSAMDEAGNTYVAETGMGKMWKYSPPFPSSAADCSNPDHLVTTPPTKTVFPTPGELTPAAIVRVPGTDHWYIDSVLLPGTPGTGGGIINEYDANGVFVRTIVQNVPPGTLLNPLGMDVGSDGTLYYAELNLNSDLSTGCGRVSMVRFVGGTPQAPQVLGQNLSFPDGITVIDSSQVHVNFPRLAPAPEPSPTTCNGGG